MWLTAISIDYYSEIENIYMTFMCLARFDDEVARARRLIISSQRTRDKLSDVYGIFMDVETISAPKTTIYSAIHSTPPIYDFRGDKI